MITEIINNYGLVAKSLGKLIEVSGYRNDFIAKKIGLQPSYFSVKKQRGNWTMEEVNNVIRVIDNEEVENYLMLELLRESKNDEIVTLDEFKKEVGWK